MSSTKLKIWEPVKKKTLRNPQLWNKIEVTEING